MIPTDLTARLDAFDAALAGASGTIDFEIRDRREPFELMSTISCSHHQRLHAVTLLPDVLDALDALVPGRNFARFFYAAGAGGSLEMTIADCHIRLRGDDAEEGVVEHIATGLAWAAENAGEDEGLYSVVSGGRESHGTIDLHASSPREAACLAATYGSAEQDVSLATGLDRIREVSRSFPEGLWTPASRTPTGQAA